MPRRMVRPMPPRGSTRIQFTKPQTQEGARLTVPSWLARIVGPEALFHVELTDEGILYRYIEGSLPAVPAWLNGGAS
jgi:hypothetical protein